MALRAAVTSCLLLAACSDSEVELPAHPDDPIMSRALGESMMIDPDLTGQNQANAAISDGSRDGSLPPLNVSPDAISKARAEAIDQVGGLAEMRSIGSPAEVTGEDDQPLPPTLVARMAKSKFVTGECAGKASYTTAWAARMPEALPVYPHGAVQSAAGIAGGTCSTKAVNFRTPVPLPDVLDFYFTKAAKAGFKTEFSQIGGEQVLSGKKGGESFAVYARTVSAGIAGIDLVTSGI
ncbi:hypothetical protein [Altererythrobacter sp. ZODW24]|uniref:hypothetical protein n=1 Tax=Altererythrobacter sp. ZODW24 TaxID=2185142 RepID=UPI000DF7E393|nr:hypothetical protein [Altererythrobacter sp. ZODW24]